MYSFGIDIGGTTVKIGLVKDNKLIDSYQITTNIENDGKNIIPDVCNSLLEYINKNNISINDIFGIGFGVPGTVIGDMIKLCPNANMKDIDCKKEVNKFFPNMKIAVENDANIAALAEVLVGNKYSYAVMLTLGTGVGGGIIMNKSIFTGCHNAAGEIGHMYVDEKYQFQCNCGLKGCLETVASATGIARVANTLNGSLKYKTCKDVFDCAHEGDEVANEAVEYAAKALGKATSLIASVIDPEAIIIGGGVSKAGDFLLDKVKKYYKEHCYVYLKDTNIELAKLGNDAGMIGAALLVLNK